MSAKQIAHLPAAASLFHACGRCAYACGGTYVRGPLLRGPSVGVVMLTMRAIRTRVIPSTMRAVPGMAEETKVHKGAWSDKTKGRACTLRIQP